MSVAEGRGTRPVFAHWPFTPHTPYLEDLRRDYFEYTVQNVQQFCFLLYANANFWTTEKKYLKKLKKKQKSQWALSNKSGPSLFLWKTALREGTNNV